MKRIVIIAFMVIAVVATAAFVKNFNMLVSIFLHRTNFQVSVKLPDSYQSIYNWPTGKWLKKVWYDRYYYKNEKRFYDAVKKLNAEELKAEDIPEAENILSGLHNYYTKDDEKIIFDEAAPVIISNYEYWLYKNDEKYQFASPYILCLCDKDTLSIDIMECIYICHDTNYCLLL